MPTIATLEKDINSLLEEQKATLSPGLLSELGTNVAMSFNRQLTRNSSPKERPDKVLYASEVGVAATCQRKLWYKYNYPLVAATLPAHTVMKFTYGDVVESVVLTLAKAAGHEVTHEQAPVLYEPGNGWSVRGKLDAIIDGTLVDVKSTTQWGMKDFQAGKGGAKFGYLAQLSFYHKYGPDADGKGWLVADKTLGHIAYVPERNTADVSALVETAIEVVTADHVDGMHRLDTVPEGTAGNLALCTECSYCDYKKECWGPELRAFNYSTGVKWLAHVVKEPKVPELSI